MTSDQCPQYPVASKGNHRVVVCMSIPVIFIVRCPPVIKFASAVAGVDIPECPGRHYHTKIPELHALVFAIAENVPCTNQPAFFSYWRLELTAIPFTVNICQTLDMANECASLTAIAHTPSIPDLYSRIIRSRVKDVG